MLTPPEGCEVITTATADYWLQDGLIFGRFRGDATRAELKDVVAALEAIRALSAEGANELIFDATELGWIDSEARSQGKVDVPKFISKAAIIVSPSRFGAHNHLFTDMMSGIEFSVVTSLEEAREFVPARGEG